MVSDTFEIKIERRITDESRSAENILRAIDVSLDGSRIVMGGNDKVVVIFTNKLEPISKYKHNSPVTCISINPQNKIVASCSLEELILYAEGNENQAPVKLKLQSKIMDMHWSPDGT